MKKFKLSEIEEIIAELEDLCDIPDQILEKDEEHVIALSGWWAHLTELGLNIHDGTYACYDADDDDYMPDFSLTCVKEEGMKEDEYLYYEQDGFVVTMANYLHGKMGIDDVSELECELCVPEEYAEILKELEE